LCNLNDTLPFLAYEEAINAQRRRGNGTVLQGRPINTKIEDEQNFTGRRNPSAAARRSDRRRCRHHPCSSPSPGGGLWTTSTPTSQPQAQTGSSNDQRRHQGLLHPGQERPQVAVLPREQPGGEPDHVRLQHREPHGRRDVPRLRRRPEGVLHGLRRPTVRELRQRLRPGAAAAVLQPGADKPEGVLRVGLRWQQDDRCGGVGRAVAGGVVVQGGRRRRAVQDRVRE